MHETSKPLITVPVTQLYYFGVKVQSKAKYSTCFKKVIVILKISMKVNVTPEEFFFS